MSSFLLLLCRRKHTYIHTCMHASLASVGSIGTTACTHIRTHTSCSRGTMKSFLSMLIVVATIGMATLGSALIRSTPYHPRVHGQRHGTTTPSSAMDSWRPSGSTDIPSSSSTLKGANSDHDLLVRTLQGEKVDRTPVWLMRQVKLIVWLMLPPTLFTIYAQCPQPFACSGPLFRLEDTWLISELTLINTLLE